MTHSVAVYLIPTRNRYGIIGPIAGPEMTPAAIREKIRCYPLSAAAGSQTPVHAIITNSTYDGLCYHAADVEALLGRSVDSIHFDEVVVRLCPVQPDLPGSVRNAGRCRETRRARPFLPTQSTHKLLAALSQASMVHIRHGRVPVDHARFNEGFMMHSSTSPLYPIIASL